MKENDLYQAIFRRKSIRNFDSTPINDRLIGEIQKSLLSLKPMIGDIKTDFKIIRSDQVISGIMKKAPHYVAAFSEAKDGHLPNIGFMLQRLDLMFSDNGLGSCWQEIPKPTKEIVEGSNLEFVILMAFGNPREELHRSNVSQFKRKPLSEISSVQGADELMEATRLAPSSSNSQNWFFTVDKNMIHSYDCKPSLLRGLLGGGHLSIDVGIADCHLQIAAEHFGLKPSISLTEGRAGDLPEGRQYVASIKIE